ncbi:MAG: damage-control phosphatase ARMT1 family protein [Candidatus Heimdallarchaeaceae archaeon]
MSLKTSPICLNCIEKTAFRLLERLKIPEENQSSIIKEIKSYLSNVDVGLTPMEISFGLYKLLQEKTGCYDPLQELKEESNSNAIKLLPKAQEYIQASDDPILTAIKISIAGNIIDYSINDDVDLSQTLEVVLKKEFLSNQYNLFREKIQQSQELTILVDNAGEIIFDTLLLELLNREFQFEQINLIVKEYPFSNDVTLKDLEQVDFSKIPNLNILSVKNTLDFNYKSQIKSIIEKSDFVISKGQGNFELLYGEELGIFFLFIIKCEEIAKVLSAKVGEIVLLYD